MGRRQRLRGKQDQECVRKNRRDRRFQLPEGISEMMVAVGEYQTRKNPWRGAGLASLGPARQTSAPPECQAPKSTPEPDDSYAKSTERAPVGVRGHAGGQQSLPSRSSNTATKP